MRSASGLLSAFRGSTACSRRALAYPATLLANPSMSQVGFIPAACRPVGVLHDPELLALQHRRRPACNQSQIQFFAVVVHALDCIHCDDHFPACTFQTCRRPDVTRFVCGVSSNMWPASQGTLTDAELVCCCSVQGIQGGAEWE